MDRKDIMVAALKYLPFQGVKIRQFAKDIHICPHTLYNYIAGQKPAEKSVDYIMLMLEKKCPEALELAKDMLAQEVCV